MALLAALLAALTTEGRAAVPMCDEVQNDPSIVTCNCICEGDSNSTSTSSFTGCAGFNGGTPAPTPGSCPKLPMCDEVQNDPSIATCSCICDGDVKSTSTSTFAGCAGLYGGTIAPTPGSCPDMLQGRRVLSAGDGLLASNPTPEDATDTRVASLLFFAENDATTPGLGIINGNPLAFSALIPCEAEPFPTQTRFARLFDLPYDMDITLRPLDQINSTCYPATSSAVNMGFLTGWLVLDQTNVVPTSTFNSLPEWTQLAIDDFDYDGFDDIVYMNRYSMSVWSAVDTADLRTGITWRSEIGTKDSSGAQRAPINEPTTGDFNGDGIKDVAWIGGDFPSGQGTLSVFFASICPGSVPNTICEGAQPFKIIVDPAAKLFPGVSGATSTIVLDKAPTTPTACGAINIPGHVQYTGPWRPGAVALGNFENNGLNPRGEPIDELVVTYVSGSAGTSSDPCSTDVQYWSFTPPNSDGSAGHTWAAMRDSVSNILTAWPLSQNFDGYPPAINLYAQAAHLDWYGTVEQAVIAVSGMNVAGGPSWGSHYVPVTVAVTGVGADAQMAVCSPDQGAEGDTKFPSLWGSAVGRFSTSTTVNPNNPGACGDFADANPGDCPYNPQIALLMGLNDGNPNKHAPFIFLWNVRQSKPDGTDNSLKCANDPTVNGFLPVPFNEIAIENGEWQAVDWLGLRQGSLLHAGDANGNSVRVGNPTVMRITKHTQPQMVIETPPSLIDYVQPNEQDSSTPAIVNFTLTGAFNTQIQFSTQSSATSATSQTTSYSTSLTESFGGEAKFGVPLVRSIDVKNTESFSQYHESDTSSQFSNYVSTALETGGQIGADDQVWWTQTTFNVFHYPVVGQTVCPASLTCDTSDPNNIVCDGGGSSANAVTLTCAASGDGCHCLSADASASLCPSIPGDGNARSCTDDQDGNVCCSLLQQQLYMTQSGPEEVTRVSQAGATAEFYQPEHELGQILSYPSNLGLLQARLSNPQPLGTLDTFFTGTNDSYETISYASSCDASSGVGTTTRHSFDTATSLTAGTPNLDQAEAGVNVTGSFDYNSSSSIDTLNSYTVGQTASSSIQLNLDGASFLNTDQYQYAVEGIVYGQVKPDAVLDTPDLTVCPIDDPSQDNALCAKDEQQAAGCTTTGPLQVAYAADPTMNGSGLWWSSIAPYAKSIDVALNNPSRWRSVQPDQVADTDLQCRGDINGQTTCYTANQPPSEADASSVWDADFYDMKGLLVTNGGTAGPQRDMATVGDEIFLQARVYNYSLIGTADDDKFPNSKVYARIYRQQLDVNNDNGALSNPSYATDADGNPLPAVPIGPNGLGDITPIPVVSPDDGSASIPAFNNTDDPSEDNISLATTSYTATDADACEYDDNGVQTCNGAYYAYWVTVWAEDDNPGGSALPELPGHGLNTSPPPAGGFDPDTIYPFITDVPLEMVSFNNASTTFSNNVGMFKKAFEIQPANSTDVGGNGAPSGLMLDLDRAALATEKTRLDEHVVVSAQVVAGKVDSDHQVVSVGAPVVGPTVVFYDGDPAKGGKAFDAEWLPYIRAGDRHFVRANYQPKTCGTHEIFLEATGDARLKADAGKLLLNVDMDFRAAVDFLISQTQGLALDFPGKAGSAHKKNLLRELTRAKEAFDSGHTADGSFYLERFSDQLGTLERQGRIDPQKAALLMAYARQVTGCIAALQG